MHNMDLEAEVKNETANVEKILAETNKVIVGQNQIGRRLLMAMISGGHVLLEGLPGLAKTTSIKSLGQVTDLAFKRIQFTPDLLPADLVGTQIYDPRSAEFKVKKGPIFTNLLLADEINRAPAKVQSALLEAMEEKQITIGENTWRLEEPFLVMATQNPIEHEGTYPLPEAQVDRFFFKLNITYTSPEDEVEIVKRASNRDAIQLEKVAGKESILAMRKFIDRIYIADKIRTYIVNLVHATRNPKKHGFPDLARLIEWGASPRASIYIDRAARTNALFEGRSFVTPQDVKDVAFDILRHRVKPTYEAEAENISSESLIGKIMEQVDVP
ncbi:MAG: MoxR family ATPase [Deltaproteobacteria bacterium]|nr:MoxR family ATPase [Deltaproteobacteria bacterium]